MLIELRESEYQSLIALLESEYQPLIELLESEFRLIACLMRVDERPIAAGIVGLGVLKLRQNHQERDDVEHRGSKGAGTKREHPENIQFRCLSTQKMLENGKLH